MQIGDVVEVIAMKRVAGIIIEIDEFCGWPHVMIEDGRVVAWPKEQVKVISETR